MNLKKLGAAGAIALAALFIYYLTLWRTARVSSVGVPQTAPSVGDHASGDVPAAASHPLPSASPQVVRMLTPEGQHQIRVLEEILRSKNDNDPRMDTELRQLSPEVRAELRDQYRGLRREALNERGTIVFLLGRNLDTAADVAFMQDVIEETPCLSLGDCTKEPPPTAGEDTHREAGADVTRAYPQLVALQAVDKLVTENSPLDPMRLDAARKMVRAGLASKDDMISRQAVQLAEKFSH